MAKIVMRRILDVVLAACVLTLFILYALPMGTMAQGDDDVARLYHQGLTLGAEGRFTEAEDLLAQASSLAPKNVALRLLVLCAEDVNGGTVSPDAGRALFSSTQAANDEDWEHALEAAQQVIDRAPGYALAHLHLGTIHAELIQQGEDGPQSAQRAIDAYREAIEIDPELGLAHYNLGVAYAVTEEWELAQAHLSTASSLGIDVPPKLASEVERRLDPSTSTGRRGFFDGLLAPLSFIPVVVSGLLDPQGISQLNQHWADTWGQGSAAYRVGFLLGTAVLVAMAAELVTRNSSSSADDGGPEVRGQAKGAAGESRGASSQAT